jgi:hypothetical protein
MSLAEFLILAQRAPRRKENLEAIIKKLEQRSIFFFGNTPYEEYQLLDEYVCEDLNK